WVANFGDRDGIELSNVELGPITIAALYSWINQAPVTGDYLAEHPDLKKHKDRYVNYLYLTDPDKAGEEDEADYRRDWRLVALQAKGNLDVVELSGVYAMTYTEGDDDDMAFNDYAVSASVTPIEGLKLEATFAGTNYKGVAPRLSGSDDIVLVDEEGTGYKLSAELTTIPDVTIGLSYWASDDEFNPIYAKLDDKEPVAFPGWNKPNERKGFEVTADTTQAGFDLGATVKRTTDANDKNEATEYEIRVSRDFNGI